MSVWVNRRACLRAHTQLSKRTRHHHHHHHHTAPSASCCGVQGRCGGAGVALFHTQTIKRCRYGSTLACCNTHCFSHRLTNAAVEKQKRSRQEKQLWSLFNRTRLGWTKNAKKEIHTAPSEVVKWCSFDGRVGCPLCPALSNHQVNNATRNQRFPSNNKRRYPAGCMMRTDNMDASHCSG